MSNPVFDLQGILVGQASLAGMVLSIDGAMVQVATRNGIVEVAYEGSIGDRVAVRDGRAVRVQDALDAPVFFV